MFVVVVRMATLDTSRFTCPHCQAKYRVVRVTANPALADREITCRSCGGPLQGREGNLALKYFMVHRAPGVKAAKMARLGSQQ